MKTTSHIIHGTVLCLLLGAAHSASAQLRFAITAYTDRGSGESSGGTFAVAGTAGQSDAGVATSSGRFGVSGGFWPPIIEELLPRLAIRRQGNQVILSWPNPSAGFQLQETSAINSSGTGWANVVGPTPSVVGANKEVSLTIGADSRGFRLCRP